MPYRPPVHTNDPKPRRPRDPSVRNPEVAKVHGSARWQRLRASVIRAGALCVECERMGDVVAATQVHHIQPIRTHPELAYERANLMPLCASCHARIEAKGRRNG